MLSDYFPAVELTVAEVEETPVAFLGPAGNSLDMLFVDSSYRGHGLGSAPLLRAIEYHPDLRLDVNEQSAIHIVAVTRARLPSGDGYAYHQGGW